jgi:hypothetical protein
MKLFRSTLSIALNVTLVTISFLSFTVQPISAQDSRIALQRGYRTGYSDGYMAGYRDSLDSIQKNFARHAEYTKADRAYSKSYGTLEDYKDGYQQGFEGGYMTGYEKRSFDSTLPENLTKRGPALAVIAEDPPPPSQTKNTAPANTTTAVNTRAAAAMLPDGQTVIIPVETELVVEMLSDLTTSAAKEGDKFQARVVSPYEINGAIVDGRIAKMTKPGRVSRRAELQLAFDQIHLSENRWSNFNASVTEVLPVQGDNVKKVDNEGMVKGKSTVKPDSIKVGASTGTGAVVGAVVGGPVGAAVGAGVGAAFGLGAVLVEKGKHIKLTKGQQLRLRTANETRIR